MKKLLCFALIFMIPLVSADVHKIWITWDEIPLEIYNKENHIKIDEGVSWSYTEMDNRCLDLIFSLDWENNDLYKDFLLLSLVTIEYVP